jgi:hypothetical protein
MVIFPLEKQVGPSLAIAVFVVAAFAAAVVHVNLEDECFVVAVFQ